MEVKIKDIDQSGRYRKEIGELFDLCKSIQEVGLLQPVVIRKDKKLVAGSRRIAAYERLGIEKIEAHIVDNLSDARKLLRAEQDENTCRKDFTVSEAMALGKELEKFEKPKADARMKSGGKPSGNLPEGGGEVREIVAAAVGMKPRTYQAAKTVINAAENDPATFQEIAKEMDETGKVWPAYEKVIDIRNGKQTEKEERPANGRTPVGVLRANEAIDCLKRIPKNDPHRKRGFQIVTDWIKHNR